MAVVVKFKFDIEQVGSGSLDAGVVSSSFDEGGVLNYEVATAVTDQAIPISTTTGVTTIQALYIKSDQNISIRQVAADTALTVRANLPFMLMGAAITALLVSNASGSTANLKIGIWGT